MKKLILTGLLFIGLTGVSYAQNVVATNLATTAAGGNAFYLLAGRAEPYSVQISVAPSISPATVKLYDNNSMADPYFGTNYVTPAYVSYASYPSNIASSYIGLNGVTNWYTNSTTWTIAVTNAQATNVLSPTAVMVIASGTVGTFPIRALHTRGIVAHSSTNASIVINYMPAR
jgi:hypothetical protein